MNLLWNVLHELSLVGEQLKRYIILIIVNEIEKCSKAFFCTTTDQGLNDKKKFGFHKYSYIERRKSQDVSRNADSFLFTSV